MTVRLKPGIVANVALAQLERDPTQPRKSFPQDSLKALAVSLTERVEVPLSVRQEGKRLIIVDGERRWRAAKLAKLKTLPCLLADLTEQLDIASSQLTTAVQREELSALDIGEFLVDLRKRQKKSTNELMAELAKRGLNEIGASKIDRYMALVDLPDWCKDLLRDRRLAEGHGTIILQAIKFPSVLKELKQSITKELNWKGGITTKEMQENVEQAFRQAGIDLNKRWGDNMREFPLSACNGCEFYKKIGGGEYCLNAKEFKRKNEEALLLKAEKEARKMEAEKQKKAAAPDLTDPAKVPPKKLKPSADNIIALKRMQHGTYSRLSYGDFDKSQCQTCQHRHMASHDGTTEQAEDTCFHVPCFNAKQKAAGKQESRSEKMREYLEAWLRPVVRSQFVERLTDHNRFGILLWLATGAIDHHTPYYSGQQHQQAAKATEPFLKQFKLDSLAAILEFATTPLDPRLHDLIRMAVDVLTREQLRFMAQHLKIDLHDPEQPYRIDETYLKMKRRAELLDFCKLVGMETVAGLSVAEIKALLLQDQAKAIIGVPSDIDKLFIEPFDKQEDDPEMFGDDGFDDLDDDEEQASPLEQADQDELAGAGVAAALEEAPATKPSRRRKAS